MIYRQISSKVCIGRVFDRFNIDYEGFIPRVPNWIHSAMNEMNLPTAMISETVPLTVIDYKCPIPEETKILEAVMYEGWRLPRIDVINERDADNMEDLFHKWAKYELDNNGYIITTFETGDIEMYIKKLPVELDDTTKLYFPLIPENESLLLALDIYLIKRLLERGHKVGTYTFNTNNQFLNPAMAWEIEKRKAINSIEEFDQDDREQVSEMIRTFLYNQHRYVTEAVNPNRKYN